MQIQMLVERKDGTEKLDLTAHVRPCEYPGQGPRFPAAKELIQQIYEYQLNSARQRFWSDFPRDSFFAGRVFGPHKKFIYISYKRRPIDVNLTQEYPKKVS